MSAELLMNGADTYTTLAEVAADQETPDAASVVTVTITIYTISIAYTLGSEC
ncbi:LxmA leader domain family RiPP [Herbidospora mongoliensis]|uniref:LxmA leader domain family RiPP n=1 Tax=Herbidospora mongoliensis TaxID=688067 RepID=UPI000AD96CD0|nr:LxmA leader domain family RiPP [Herbidospora mongoliensis]